MCQVAFVVERDCQFYLGVMCDAVVDCGGHWNRLSCSVFFLVL